jgi:hypothetical protein
MNIQDLSIVAACCWSALVLTGSSALAEASHHGAVERAFACAEAHTDLAASLTLTFERTGEHAVAARYSAGTDEWAPVPGVADRFGPDAEKDLVKAWDDMKERYGSRGGLVPRDIRATITEPVFLEETAVEYIFSFVPGPGEDRKPMSDTMIDALETRFRVDRATSCMTGFSMISTGAFKPAPIATIEVFELVLRLSKVEQSGIPLITGFRSAVKGKALFKAFDESSQVTISDVEISSAT